MRPIYLFFFINRAGIVLGVSLKVWEEIRRKKSLPKMPKKKKWNEKLNSVK